MTDREAEYTAAERRVRKWCDRIVTYAAIMFGVGGARWAFGPADSGRLWSGWLALGGAAALLTAVAVAVAVHARASWRAER